MADQTDQTPPAAGNQDQGGNQDKNTPPAGNDPKPNGQGDQSQNQNNNDNKNDDKFIPKHRFDEIAKERDELRKWRSEQEANAKKREEDELKKKGEFETLAKQKEQEAIQAKTELQTERINNKIISEASKVGVVDIDAVLSLIDRSKVAYGDNGVQGVTEAVTALLEAKPYLKGKANNPVIGGDTNPSSDDSGEKTFKASQLKDTKFYRENEKDILRAMRLGKIIDDEPS